LRTINRAITELLTAKERCWSVSARFDEHWGFVERAFVEGNESASGWDLKIREFRVTPE
jgi:hypothetical protein